MSDALPLPSRPNLEQYKKLAKDLRDACKSGAIAAWCAHWPEYATQIEQRWTRRDRKDCTLTAAQFFLAREHGFSSWPVFAQHVQELARANSPVSTFEAAADMIVNGELDKLAALLAAHPGLIRERSTREHCSTLLHYVSANGIEDFRQKTPANIVGIAKLLLGAGAEVDATSEAYGGGSTTLGLAATSLHPQKAGVQIELLQTLIDHGARLDLDSAGNKHAIVLGCLANGQPEAANFLASLGAPLDVESAAGLNRLEELKKYAKEATVGELESALLYACGYGAIDTARFLLDNGVNVGAEDDQNQTALHWATWTPHVEIIGMLIEHGANVHAKERRFQATPLDNVLWTWQNGAKGCYEAVALLVQAGARLNREQWRNPDEMDSAMLRKIDNDSRMLAALQPPSGP